MAEPELDPEQLVEAIKRLKVADVLLSSFSTVAQIGYAKLEGPTRDLEQARLAIDSLRALVPVLEGAVPDETLRDFRQVVTNLQLAYASAAAGGDREGASGTVPRAPDAAAEGEQEPSDEHAGGEEQPPGER